MILKKFLKFTFSGLLLSAIVSAYAEGEGDKVVTLANGGGSITWSEFVNVINNPSSIQGSADDTELNVAQSEYDAAVTAKTVADEALPGKKKAYEDAEENLSSWETQSSALTRKQGTLNSQLTIAQGNTEKISMPWLTTAYQNAVSFQTYFNNYVTSKGTQDGDNGSISYKFTEDPIWGNDLTLSFNGIPQGENTSEWSENVNVQTFFTALSGKTVDNTYINCGKDSEGNYNYAGANGLLIVSYNGRITTLANSAATALQALTKDDQYTEYKNQAERDNLAAQLKQIETQLNEISEKISAYTEVQSGKEVSEQTRLRNEYRDAQTAKETADSAVTTAKDKLDSAQAAYDQAVAESKNGALANYKTVTLTGDVTADTTIKEYDGTIYGENHVITLASGVTELFGTFSGILSNVAVNGKIFKANRNAAYNNVASWANNTGSFYNTNGNLTENIGTLGQLGFTVRNNFGVDFNNNTLASLSDGSKVYSITVYEPNSTTHRYVQTRENSKFFAENAQEYSIPTNMFAKSETYDLKGYANVFYDDNTCERAVIVDRQNFYCPADINVGTVDLDRQFQAGQNAVCLPFELNYDDANIDALCTYDMETSEKFWFKKVAGPIPANKPVLLVAKNNFSLDLSNITIKKTDAQIVEDEGNANDPSKSFGLFKKATRDEIIGAYEAHKVYGLTKNGEFSPVAENVNFPAFRMVLYSNNVQQNNMPAPRRIGILDENGKDITGDLTGIEDLRADTSSLNIATGSGEIIFTSDADYGKVAIYTLDGKVAAEADVVAGTTTVSLAKGLYIVNGKKVMVK